MHTGRGGEGVELAHMAESMLAANSNPLILIMSSARRGRIGDRSVGQSLQGEAFSECVADEGGFEVMTVFLFFYPSEPSARAVYTVQGGCQVTIFYRRWSDAVVANDFEAGLMGFCCSIRSGAGVAASGSKPFGRVGFSE